MEGKKKGKTFNQIFRSTFDTQDGRTMLYWILEQCGYFQGDPRLISPDLLAFAHRMLREAGIEDPSQAGTLMEHMMSVARHVKDDTERRTDDEHEDFLED